MLIVSITVGQKKAFESVDKIFLSLISISISMHISSIKSFILFPIWWLKKINSCFTENALIMEDLHST